MTGDEVIPSHIYLTRRVYAAMVAAMDFSVGQAVDSLKATGMYNNSLIMLSSDNGGESVIGGGYNWPYR